jgi:hypothetical protein
MGLAPDALLNPNQYETWLFATFLDLGIFPISITPDTLSVMIILAGLVSKAVDRVCLPVNVACGFCECVQIQRARGMESS